MGYNPQKYKDLFPNGLFGYDKPLTNWKESQILFALNQERQKMHTFALASGIKVKKGSLSFTKGFCNYSIYEVDLNKKIQVVVEKKMIHPIDAFKKNKGALLLSNLGYFYFTNGEEYDPFPFPRILTSNLVVQDNFVYPPVINSSCLFVMKDGTFSIKYAKAKGNLKIGSDSHFWVGSLTDYNMKDKVIVYTASNIPIVRKPHPVMKVTRVCDKLEIKPKKGRKLLLCKIQGSSYRIEKIVTKKIIANSYDLVLSVVNDISAKCGDKITFTSLDEINISDVASAVSAGPMLYNDYAKSVKQVRKEKFHKNPQHPSNPHMTTKKMARGCILLTKHKLIVVQVDGIPGSGDIYPGVTFKEFHSFVKSKFPNFEMALLTDPSSTMKSVYKRNGKTHVFGNLDYLDFKKYNDGRVDFWPNGRKGRKINSYLIVT